MRGAWTLAALMTLMALVAGAQTADPRPLNAAQRHRLAQFEAALAAQPSATKALEGWCRGRRFTDGGSQDVKVSLSQAASAIQNPKWVRAMLAVGPKDLIKGRHVILECQSALLSEADNWYVPSRLTPDMRDALAHSFTPFGTVAAPLHFTRQPLASRRGAGPGCPKDTVLTHRALLRLPDGTPLAVVLECYEPDVLAPAGHVFRSIHDSPPEDTGLPSLVSVPSQP